MNYTKTYINDLIIAQKSILKLDKLTRKSILITGASGLIGSACVDFLLQLNDSLYANNTIYAAGRDIEKLKYRFLQKINRNDFFLLEYDAIKDISFFNDFDYIIYAASPAYPLMYINNPVETMLANIVGMKNILEYARKHNTNRILYISSSEVYGKKETNSPYKNNDYGYVDILNSRACYPSAKRATETLCAAYYNEYNIESVIVRPGHVYGPTAVDKDNRAATQFFHEVISGNNIIMKSNGHQLRSYCYIMDCVSAIFSVLLNGKICHAYNIANPISNVTIKELAECIAKESGKKIVFQEASQKEQSGYNLMENSCLDASELIELGWKGQFDLQTGVKHTLKILNNVR